MQEAEPAGKPNDGLPFGTDQAWPELPPVDSFVTPVREMSQVALDRCDMAATIASAPSSWYENYTSLGPVAPGILPFKNIKVALIDMPAVD